MTKIPGKDTDDLPADDQAIEVGKLDVDRKLDIALQGSMMTSEPPQITEPRTIADDDEEADI